MSNWLDASSTSNRYKQMYIKGFLDISGGNLILRNNNFYLKNGDASLNGRLILSGDASLNNRLFVGQDVIISGNLYTNYPANSIPPSAITGGIPASTGIFLNDVSVNSRLFVAKDVSMNSNLYVAGTITSGNLTITGNSTFSNIYSNSFYENGVSISSKYATIASPTFTGTVSGITSAMVGLGNVNNTSDLDKPISTAVQNALNNYISSISPAFTGVPTAPTASIGTNTTQLATTSYVVTGISGLIGTAPTNLRTLQTIASAINNDPSFGLKVASLTAPYFVNNITTPKLFVTGDSSLNNRLFVSNDTSMNGNLRVGRSIFEGGSSLVSKYAQLASPTFTGSITTPDITITTKLTTQNASINSLYVASDASLNGNLLVTNDLSINGNLYANYPINSIPSNAIIDNVNKTYVDSSLNTLRTYADSELSTKSSITYVDSSLNSLRTETESALNTKSSQSYVDSSLNSLRTYTDSVLSTISTTDYVDSSLNALRTYTDSALNTKSSQSYVDSSLNTLRTYTDSALSTKADSLTLNNYALLTGANFSGVVSSTDVTSNRLFVTNDTSLNGNVYIAKDLTVNGNLAVKTYSTNYTIFSVSYEFIVAEDMSLNGRLFMSGDLSMNQNLYVGNDASFNGKLFVSGNSILNNVNIVGDINAVTQSSNDSSTKLATTAFIKNQGYAQLSGAVFTGDVSVNSGNFTTITQPTNDSSSKVATTEFVYNNFQSLLANANFIGDVSVGNRLNVINDVSINGNIMVGRTIYENGSSLISKYATLNSPDFVGDVNVSNRLFIGSDTSLNGNLYVINKTILNDDVSMNKNLDLSGSIIAHNNINVYGIINQYTTSLDQGYIVNYSNVTASGDLNVNGITLGKSTNGQNTIVGINSGSSLTSGINNTILGYASGSSITSGSNNILVGSGVNSSSSTVSNEITLGNSSITILRCQASSITSLSDVRDKTNIETIPVGLDFINKLNPVKFTWNTRDGMKTNIDDFGFIAQELQSAENEIGIKVPNLIYENNPEKLEASYGALIPIMVKAIKELKELTAKQQDEIELLKRLSTA